MASYITTILLALISVPLLMGKGSFFINGYSTMTPAEKEKYKSEHDVKKMCRSAGLMLLSIAALTAVISYYDSQIVTLYCMATIIAIVLFFVTYINAGCRK